MNTTLWAGSRGARSGTSTTPTGTDIAVASGGTYGGRGAAVRKN
jgi:hypothetical protein